MGWLKNIFRNPVIKLKKISPEDIGKRTSKEIRHAAEEEFKRKVMPREAKEILNEIERIVQPFDEICTVAKDLYKVSKNCK